MRKGVVWIHRWVGLLLAGFLILEGLTGSLLAFREPLERWVNPQLFGSPSAGAAPLDLATLATLAEAAEPHARLDYFLVYHDQVVVRVSPRVNSATGGEWPLTFDHLYLDPYTGRELGTRREGDITQGRINVISFLYALHMNLSAGTTGYLILGIVALAWTIDCFVGLYLTMPAAFRDFLQRWRPSWLVKINAKPVRVNFDLHRAGGLWLWPVLLVFAWSSVMFNLNPTYIAVTRSVLDYEDPMSVMQRPGLHESPAPQLNWSDAQILGERALRRVAAERGFKILRPYGMAYIESLGVYTYAVESSLNVQNSAWSTSVWVDGDTGDIRDVSVPSGEHTGNTVETWLRALHFADLHDSTEYRIFVAATGLATTMLSVTGIYLWWKKRRARRWSQGRAAGTARQNLATRSSIGTSAEGNP
ncbi:MAG: PepSY-associated TM helix domain-containing protein [Proteobacteria bacterium]|nr:PepSY-associated TM helix domain-containing protein [Pseudomonadota bacterium]